jgi:hypothetical protein
MAKNKPYLVSSNIFGTGTLDIEIRTDCTIEDIYNQYKTLEFHNITIAEGAKLKPKHTMGGMYGWESQPNDFHPLYLKCSGTLTVNGELTAQNCGGASNFYNGDVSCYQNAIKTPVPLTYNQGGNNQCNGWSADSKGLYRLLEYGKNGNFFKFKDFFLVGAGGGGEHSYRRSHASHHHHYWVWMKGFSNGGYTDEDNRSAGCGGGFVGLYYKNLYIGGVAYGKPGCDITKISANGYREGAGSGELDSRFGGGCLVVSARTIIIGSNGTINADGYGSQKFIVHTKEGYSYSAGRGNSQIGFRPSFLNNFPALCSGQSGYHWDESTNTYVNSEPTNNTYHFDDGSGAGIPNCYVQGYDAGGACGGAGIAIGIRITDDMEDQSIQPVVPDLKTVTYYYYYGYTNRKYAWTGSFTYGYFVGGSATNPYRTRTIDVTAYTDSETPTVGEFATDLVIAQGYTVATEILEVGDNYIKLQANAGLDAQRNPQTQVFTLNRSIINDIGQSKIVRYTKVENPIVGSKLYDEPNNYATGSVIKVSGTLIYDEFGRLLEPVPANNMYVME